MIVVKYVRKVQLRFQRVNECTRHYVTSTNMRVQIRWGRVRHEYECTSNFVTTSTTRVQSRRWVSECTKYFVSPTPTSHTCTRDFITTNTKIQSRRQARYGTRYFVTSNVPIFKINWNNKVYAALKREKYITKLFDWNKEVLRVALKRKNILPKCYAWHWKKKNIPECLFLDPVYFTLRVV